MQALRECHAQPALRPHAGRVRDDLDVALDEASLLVFLHQRRNAGVVVSLGSPFPIPGVSLPYDLWILPAYVTVEIHGTAKPMLVHGVHDSPKSDTIAVVTPAVDAVALRLVGRGDGRALAHTEPEGFDVERDVDGEPAAAGPWPGLEVLRSADRPRIGARNTAILCCLRDESPEERDENRAPDSDFDWRSLGLPGCAPTPPSATRHRSHRQLWHPIRQMAPKTDQDSFHIAAAGQ